MEEKIQNKPTLNQQALSHRSSFWQTAFFSLIFLAIGIGIGFWLKGSLPQSPVITANNQEAVSPSPMPTEVAPSPKHDGWKTYIFERLKLSFKLPPELASQGEMKEVTITGEKGTQLCLSFTQKEGDCNFNSLVMGTVSQDFEQGRGGIFLDLAGFEVKDGKYFALNNRRQSFEIPSDLVTRLTSDFGVSILKVIGKNETEGEWQGPIAGTPGNGSIGALLNLADATYPGFAVSMPLAQGLTDETFTEILKTFEFLP